MRKTVLTALLILAGTSVFAQGNLLKGLGEKAKNAVGSQIGKTVTGALGLGANGSSQQSAAPAVSMTYAQDLLDPNYNEDYFPAGELKDVPVFNSYSDAINACPGLPQPGSLKTFDDMKAYAARAAAVRQATVDMCTKYAMRQSELSAQMMNASSAASSQGGSSIQGISAAEVMKALADAGVNPETATEEQVKDAMADYIAKKAGVTKQQALEMMNNPQPAETEGNRMNQIEAELSAIYEAKVMSILNASQNALTSLQAALLGGKTAPDETTLTGALQALRSKIIAAWPASAECKEVNRLEKEQGEKGRARQNEIIDRWNSARIDEWVAKMSVFQKAESADAAKLAALDAELDAMSEADRQTSDWAAAKQKAVMLNGFIISCMEMPAKVMECPLVHHAQTGAGE